MKVTFPAFETGTEHEIVMVAAGKESTMVNSPGGTLFSMGEGGATGREQESPTKKPEKVNLGLDGVRILGVVDLGSGDNTGGLILEIEGTGEGSGQASTGGLKAVPMGKSSGASKSGEPGEVGH